MGLDILGNLMIANRSTVMTSNYSSVAFMALCFLLLSCRKSEMMNSLQEPKTSFEVWASNETKEANSDKILLLDQISSEYYLWLDENSTSFYSYPANGRYVDNKQNLELYFPMQIEKIHKNEDGSFAAHIQNGGREREIIFIKCGNLSIKKSTLFFKYPPSEAVLMSRKVISGVGD